MLRRIAERGIRRSASAGDDTALAEETLRILYQRKAFREETGTDEEHYLEGTPPPRHGHPQARATDPGPTADLRTCRGGRVPRRDQAGLMCPVLRLAGGARMGHGGQMAAIPRSSPAPAGARGLPRPSSGRAAGPAPPDACYGCNMIM